MKDVLDIRFGKGSQEFHRRRRRGSPPFAGGKLQVDYAIQRHEISLESPHLPFPIAGRMPTDRSRRKAQMRL
ncbi:MAG: hypothetical protein U5N26_02140 [Candidatus Marinimicrobia bacterium]|nr:hypothetical protein [Candidatus Neomarinimicrobiota bacterium]